MGLMVNACESRILRGLVLPALVMVPGLQAQAPEEEFLGESPERYGQIRVIEGEAILHKGEVEEALVRGLPVAEGDVVESRGRGVLQLADGTRIAFSEGTRLEISALFAERDGVRVVVLRLERGRLRVALGGQEEVELRVDCPSGSLRLQDRSRGALLVKAGGETQARITVGRGLFSNPRGRLRLVAGDQLTVMGPEDALDRVRGFNTYDEDAFDAWAETQLRFQTSESLGKVPYEIRHYAGELDGNGDWVQVDDLGWCWRPRVSQPEWRPYWVGHWGCHPGGLTWVSEEPWGFLTYHFGRWGWQARVGWYWVPGVYYSPAWVGWQSNDAYFGWAPLGIYNRPVAWAYGAWAGGHCWNVLGHAHVGQGRLHRWIVNDAHTIAHFGGPGRPWRYGPMLVRHPEWRDPTLFRRVVGDSSLNRLRIQEYERRARQGTGRVVVWRPPANGPEGRTPRPFEQVEDRRPVERFVPKDRRNPGVPVDHRPAPTPAPEGREPRPRETHPVDAAPFRPDGREGRPREERRVDPAPHREVVIPEGRTPRPREERRPDPAPVPREYRPEGRESRPREERRVDPAPVPRPEGRESRPREERRPDPAPRPSPSPSPAPRPAPGPKPEREQKR